MPSEKQRIREADRRERETKIRFGYVGVGLLILGMAVFVSGLPLTGQKASTEIAGLGFLLIISSVVCFGKSQ